MSDPITARAIRTAERLTMDYAQRRSNVAPSDENLARAVVPVVSPMVEAAALRRCAADVTSKLCCGPFGEQCDQCRPYASLARDWLLRADQLLQEAGAAELQEVTRQ